jgi:hypothetical protein
MVDSAAMVLISRHSFASLRSRPSLRIAALLRR